MKKLALLALTLGGSLSWGLPLPPCVAPNCVQDHPNPVLGPQVNAPFLTTLSTPYTTNGTDSTGTVVQAVQQSGSNLIFYYQIVADATSISPITSFVLRGFAGFNIIDFTQSTSIGAGTPFTDPTTSSAPGSVSRSTGTGNAVNFIFESPGQGVGGTNPTTPPLMSRVFAFTIDNAAGWQILSGNVSGSIDNRRFDQLAPTPEPSFYVAVSMGLVGLFVARRRKVATASEQE